MLYLIRCTNLQPSSGIYIWSRRTLVVVLCREKIFINKIKTLMINEQTNKEVLGN